MIVKSSSSHRSQVSGWPISFMGWTLALSNGSGGDNHYFRNDGNAARWGERRGIPKRFGLPCRDCTGRANLGFSKCSHRFKSSPGPLDSLLYEDNRLELLRSLWSLLGFEAFSQRVELTAGAFPCPPFPSICLPSSGHSLPRWRFACTRDLERVSRPRVHVPR
jgi:hypothetical protein